MHFYTVGVYGVDETNFFSKLEKEGIDTFVDIRLRRAVRGAQYAFANRARLEGKLAELGIRYFHEPALAPTKKMIETQAKADKVAGIARRKRTELVQGFIEAYKGEVLGDFDLEHFITLLEHAGARKVALFCVEATPGACHRSLVSEKIATDFGMPVTHL